MLQQVYDLILIIIKNNLVVEKFKTIELIRLI